MHPAPHGGVQQQSARGRGVAWLKRSVHRQTGRQALPASKHGPPAWPRGPLCRQPSLPPCRPACCRDLESGKVGTLGQLLECFPSRLLTSQPGRLPEEEDVDAVVTLAVRLRRAPVRGRSKFLPLAAPGLAWAAAALADLATVPAAAAGSARAGTRHSWSVLHAGCASSTECARLAPPHPTPLPPTVPLSTAAEEDQQGRVHAQG